MANNPIHEMIAAFAVGCMDNENFIQFKDYIKEGGELPKNELGELQNIVSMVPIILDLETPDPSLKDNVAKKLINMKDEIKTKIREERKKTFSTGIQKAPSFVTRITAQKNKILTQVETPATTSNKYPDTFHSTMKVDVPEEIAQSVARELLSSKIDDKLPQSLFEPNLKQKVNGFKPEQIDKSGSGLIGWIALLISIVLFAALGYYAFSSISSLNRKIEELESKTASFKNELATSTGFVNNYVSLIEFFNYKNIEVVNLTGLIPGDSATARAFLAFDEKEGLIQFKDANPLQPNQGYQLWLVSKGQSYSMGVYSPTSSEYLRITTFPFIPRDQVQSIKITIESNTGSPTPSTQIFFSGNL